MRDNFKDKYRIESARIAEVGLWVKWDLIILQFVQEGRECYFGEIVEGHMILSEIGEIAKTEWLKSPEIRPDMNLILDDYIIMPNHIHGIIQIGDNEYNKYDDGIIAGCDCRCGDAVHGRDAMHGVSKRPRIMNCHKTGETNLDRREKIYHPCMTTRQA